MNEICESIRAFNQSRDPERLAMKYEKMRTNEYVFLRGSCHLFYELLEKITLPTNAPAGWICGDLHLENFGSYKGSNRLTYFDINDFDESILAPVTWDLVRFLTSIFAAKDTLDVGRSKVLALCETFLSSYAQALEAGKAYWVERETADGLIQKLLTELRDRDRDDHLDKFTELNKKRRTLRCDGERSLPVEANERKTVEKLVRNFANSKKDSSFFDVLDVARRIAGVGSLGAERYVVLIRGKGTADSNYLLDIKASARSSLSERVQIQQPTWTSNAQRIVTSQTRMQAVPMAFLEAVEGKHQAYVVRGLQPSEDRVALDDESVDFSEIRNVVAQMGQIVAWSQLRSSGQQGAASTDSLIDFGGHHKSWRTELIAAAEHCAAQNLDAWKHYVTAYDAGQFK